MDLFPRQHAGHSSGSSTVPDYFYMQRMFWAVIGSAIAFAALLNLLDHILLWQRQRSLNARPRSLLWSFYATFTALGREINAASLPPLQFRGLKLRSPPLGKTILVLSYLITVIVFCFYKYDTADQWSWEDIAYRCGCIAQVQLPLIFLLAGKQNIVGFLTGMGYERLNWLHRWVARILWLTTTLHLMFWFRSWARYDYITVKLSTDRIAQTGFAAWCILTAVVLTSFAPVRQLSYEVFVITHLVLFSGVIGAIMLHVTLGQTYLWVCVALFFFDRVFRFVIMLFANFSLFHRRIQGRDWPWANKAVLTPLPGNVTRIAIDKPALRWSPGQHVFLSCHTVAPLQSHPFTIASLPSDEKLEFLVQARKGGTKRFHSFASKDLHLPEDRGTIKVQHRLVGIEGPYGKIRPLRQFDSICFLAGSTGATFTVPLMRDIVHRWKAGLGEASPIVTQRIRFVWVVKSRDRVKWFQDQLEAALLDVETIQKTEGHLDKELNLSIYITCDEELEDFNPGSSCEPSAHREAAVMVARSAALNAGPKEQVDDELEVRYLDVDDKSSDGGSLDGRCCCKTTVDEDGAQNRCTCYRPLMSTTSSPSINKEDAKGLAAQRRAATSHLKMIGGRPKSKTILRKVLEEAEGESAVVVCGPQGLQDDVRRSVVALSDERAVHKGTGAQGIYLHVEGFCY